MRRVLVSSGTANAARRDDPAQRANDSLPDRSFALTTSLVHVALTYAPTLPTCSSQMTSTSSPVI
jgi:hypothetical protein